MKRKLIKRPALAVCTLAVLGFALAAVLSATPTYAAPAYVSTWAQFVTELGNASTDEIVLTANITASSSPTINRSVVINGQGNTITFGGNSLTLGNVTATLRLENINIVKTSGGNNAAVYGNAINSANWRIEVCDVTSGTASGQRGLVDAEKASVFVYGTGSNLRVEGLDNINHFKVKNFEMTPGSEMYLGTQITTNGDSDPCILMEYNSNGSGNGTFILRQGAHLTVENRGASMDEGHFQGYAKGSDGIVGGIKEILFEENSTIDITVTNMGFWSMANYGGTGPTFEMKEGAVFNATTTHTEAHWCVAFCRDFNSTAYGSTTFTLSGEGTEMNLSAASERANTQGGALLMRGDGSVITVKEGAKINASSSRTQTFYMHGVGTEFKIDGGKVNVTQPTPHVRPAIRMYGGGITVNVTNGGELKINTNGDGTQSSTQNQGIQYSDGSALNKFSVSGSDSTVEIIAKFGPAIRSSSPLEVEASDGAVFVAHGRTASTTTTVGAIFADGSASYLSFTLDNPKYFDIRNYSTVTGGAPAVYSETNNPTANPLNFVKVINSDFSIWPRQNPVNGSQNAYFENSPTKAWTRLSFLVNGSWMHTVVSSDSLQFPGGTFFTNVQATGMQNYSRISANNAAPIIDALRQPTDADKYLHGHASIMDISGIRDARTDEVYVTVQVKDAGGNPVEIQDMYGAYGYTAEWVTGATMTVYGEAPGGGLFKIPYIPQDPGLHAYVPGYLLSIPAQGSACFLPAGYTFEVLSAYRSSVGSKSTQIALGELTPHVHESNYVHDIAGPLTENQGAAYAPCIDKTPPKPAVIDGELDDTPKLTIPEGAAAVSGLSAEKGSVDGDVKAVIALKRGEGAFEIVTADGTPVGSGGIPVTADVNSATGLWALAIPGHLTLTLGDIIQVYLVDSAGNVNPAVDTQFHDALTATGDCFPAGTIAHVVESAFILHIRQIVHNPGSAAMRSWPGEGYSRITDQRSNLLIAPKKYNIITSAGFSNGAKYTTVELKGVFKNDTVRIQNAVPQYFTPAGHALLAGGAAPLALAAPTPGDAVINVDNDREYWVTVFISPVSYGTARYAGGIVDHHFGTVTG